MLGQLIAAELFAPLLIFARVGSALMLLPAIGDSVVPARYRLMLALLISLLVSPVLSPGLPALPDDPIALTLLLVGEILIGVFLGLVARLVLTAVDVAGMVISFNLSLANAFVFNPAMTAQSSLIGTFLTTVAVLLILVSDLHHLMLMGVIDSYMMFTPGTGLPTGDMADTVARQVSGAFVIGVRMAAPFLVIGLIFYLGLGLMARLMPQAQVFFIAIPMQVMVGILVLALTLSGVSLYWLRTFEDALITFPQAL